MSGGVDLRWYARRLSRMSPSEVGWRALEQARHRTWARYRVPVGAPVPRPPGGTRRFTATLPAGAVSGLDAAIRSGIVETAEDILAGRWEILGVARSDAADPDWFADPVTGRRAPQDPYCFAVDHRSEDVTGNVKQLWDLSRMHHLTILSSAYAVTGEDRYAEVVDRQLRSWWAANPFLSGVHWTSAIEVGMRLIAWVWIRRLLDGWVGAPLLFEGNDLAAAQIWWHQRYLEGFQSRGSSSNNHVIAEASGQLVAALAFPWFERSDHWRDGAAQLLEQELAHNTFPSGVDRELAFDYHGYVLELAIAGAVEADRSGHPLTEATWQRITRMLDVVAAVVDQSGMAPRQNDGDGGRALVLGPEANRWSALLAFGVEVLGAPDWWPAGAADAAGGLLASMAGTHRVPARPDSRPSHFVDAGLTLLRTPAGPEPEIWCRCDAGPLGFLAIAAHGHADALSIEVRHGGVEVLADPGTYCYHGEPRWRSYFRSTLGHNTVELASTSQSVSGGPFLWVRHARSRLVGLEERDGGVVTWEAEHDGYAELDPPAIHRRRVHLDPVDRRIEVLDTIRTDGDHSLRMAWHLGPEVTATVGPDGWRLGWTDRDGRPAGASVELPDQLEWSAVTGSDDPVLGWYSPRFGAKVPSTTLVGAGRTGADPLLTVLDFHR